MSTGGLSVLSSDLKSPPVSETSVDSDFFHSLDILSELGVQIVGGDLLVLAVLEVSSSVEEPLREAVSFRVGDDFGDLVDFFLGQLAGSLLVVYSGLLAESDGESTADTSDGSDGVRNQSLSFDVGVQDTDNVLEVFRFLEV